MKRLRYLEVPVWALVVGLLVGCGQAPSPRPLQLPAATPLKTAALVTDPAPPSKKYRLFKIDSVLKRGSMIRISGSTDFPNGAGVRASIEFKNKRGDDETLEASERVNNGWSDVKSGKWHVDLDAPIASEFYKERHSVTAEGMLKEGQGVVDRSISGGDDDEAFITKKNVKIEEGANVSSAALPRPGDYAADSPERALAEVIADWQRHDWQDMGRWVHRMRKNSVAQHTSPTDPKFDMANGDNMFDESPVADRVEACKSQFRSWEVRQARFGEVNVGADPEAPIQNAQVTVHLKTILDGTEKDLDMIWVLEYCRSDNSPHPKDRWGVEIDGLRPH